MIKLTNDKNYNLFYYYFNTNANAKPYKDTKTPIVFSISTFRSWDKDTKIFVIDSSPNKLDWGIFPDLLNFSVIRKPLSFDNCEEKKEIEFNKELKIEIILDKYLLSRPSMLYSVAQEVTSRYDTIIACDCDIFFLNNPFPLDSDHFQGVCCLPGNTGYYYFTNNGDGVDEVFESWCSVCDSCLTNEILQKAVCTNYFFRMFNALKENTFKKFGLQEEVVWFYINEKNKNLKTKTISTWENFHFILLQNKNIDFYKIKNFHLCTHNPKSIISRDKRGLFCLYISEFRHMIENVLKENIKDILPNFDCDVFSIKNVNKVKNLLETNK